MLKKYWGVILLFILYFLAPVNVFANTVINGNDFAVFQRTKEDIQAAYEVGYMNISDNIWLEEPSYTAPYKAGVLKQEYLDEVLENVNYYRWLIGSPEITVPMTNREDLQTAVVLQYLNLSDKENGVGLTHYLSDYPKPDDMTEEFYKTAYQANHNIISSYGYGMPIFPFLAESIFTYTAGHRDAILSPAVYSLQIGTGKVTYGDSDMRNYNSDNFANGMTHDFAAYPSPGYFPTQEYTMRADWSIYFNPELYSNMDQYLNNITATVENLDTGLIEEFSYEKGNLEHGSDNSRCLVYVEENRTECTSYSNHLYLKNPTGGESGYVGNYKVTIRNLVKNSGEVVDIEYIVNFFDLYEGTKSDISKVDFSSYGVQWEDNYNESSTRQFLPQGAYFSLESGGYLYSKINGYIITKNSNPSYYDAKPVYDYVPSYITNTNGRLDTAFKIRVIENDEEKLLSVTFDKEKYNVGDSATLTVTASSLREYYIYEWYREVNGTFIKISNDENYILGTKTLTIKNVTYDNYNNYYVKAIPGENLYNFYDVVSQKYNVPLNFGGKVAYQIYANNQWSTLANDGAVGGQTGKGLKATAFRVMLGDVEYEGDILYRAHLQSTGWESPWYKTGNISGTLTDKRIEAVQLKLNGDLANYYDIYYRVHSQNFGWLGWAKNGESAGTSGYGYRVEAIEIKLVKKGGSAPGATTTPYVVKDTTSVLYQTQVQNKGWLSSVSNGATSGTVGSGLRMETLKVSLVNQKYEGSIEYRSHIQNLGWETTWKKNGEQSGTTGKGLRLEAIEIRLTGEMANYYDIYYRVHSQNVGWLGWTKNGASAGTSGYGYRVEAIEIKLVKKGSAAPGSTVNSYIDRTSVSYQASVQNKGWLESVSNGEIAGTTNQGLKMEAIKISLKNQGYTGNIEYRSHIQNLGWETTWKKNGEQSGSTGKGLRLEAVQLRLTGEISNYYDIYYRVHSQNFGWLGWAKNGESAGTSGYGYRIEAIEIKLVKKGSLSPSLTKTPYKSIN